MAGVSDYIIKLLSVEQYAFSWPELKAALPATDAALKNQLARLVKKGEILSLRAGFYLILPPRYRSYGKLPLELYVEKLFRYLEKPYYLGLYSAAGFHGASHQQVQQDYLLTQVPNVPAIRKGAIHLRIFVASTWPEKNILQRKSDAGHFNISSPVLTAADLIHYQNKVGGINRIFTVIEELTDQISNADVQDLLKWYPHVSTIQRLGYLLESIDSGHTAIVLLQEFLATRKHFPVLLKVTQKQKPGRTGNDWKVDVNAKLESDL